VARYLAAVAFEICEAT